MKLLKLEVEGYRSLKKVSWSPGDLNILIGPNGSGKTNLLKVLDLLAQSAVGKLGECIQREGGILAMLWDGRAESMSIELESSIRPPQPIVARRKVEAFSMHYRLALARWPGRRVISEEQLIMKPEGLDQEDEGSELLLSGPWSARIRDSRSRKMIDLEDSEEFRLGTETLLSTISDPFIRSSPFDPVFYYRRDLTKWTVYEELDTRTDSPIRQAQIARWQDKLSTDGENLASFLHTSYEEQPEFKEEIDLAMRAAFGEAFDRLVFPPAFEQRIQLGIRWKGLKRVQPAADLSDGTLRFLYLLAILANPDPPPLIAIEEPEVGLHPSMFGIIAEYAAEVSKRTQVVISTHSPDFLDAFGDHEVTTTVFHWHKGETLLGVLQGDELAEWLKHYRLGEYFRSGEFDLWLTEQLSNENDHAGAPESLA